MKRSFVEDTVQKSEWDGNWMKVDGLKWWVIDKGQGKCPVETITGSEVIRNSCSRIPMSEKRHSFFSEICLALWSSLSYRSVSWLSLLPPPQSFHLKRALQHIIFEPTAKHIHHSSPAQGRELPAAQWHSSAMHDAGGSASGNNSITLPATWKHGTHRCYEWCWWQC